MSISSLTPGDIGNYTCSAAKDKSVTNSNSNDDHLQIRKWAPHGGAHPKEPAQCQVQNFHFSESFQLFPSPNMHLLNFYISTFYQVLNQSKRRKFFPHWSGPTFLEDGPSVNWFPSQLVQLVTPVNWYLQSTGPPSQLVPQVNWTLEQMVPSANWFSSQLAPHVNGHPIQPVPHSTGPLPPTGVLPRVPQTTQNDQIFSNWEISAARARIRLSSLLTQKCSSLEPPILMFRIRRNKNIE